MRWAPAESSSPQPAETFWAALAGPALGLQLSGAELRLLRATLPAATAVDVRAFATSALQAFAFVGQQLPSLAQPWVAMISSAGRFWWNKSTGVVELIPAAPGPRAPASGATVPADPLLEEALQQVPVVFFFLLLVDFFLVEGFVWLLT